VQPLQQLDAFAASVQFAQAEGIIPAPEANHAVAGAIREALRAKEEDARRVILFNLCGHGHFDMQAYIDYHAGKLQNYDYPAEEIAMALAGSSPHGLQNHPRRRCVHLVADAQPLPVSQHQLECGIRTAGVCRRGFEQRKSHRLAFPQPLSPVVKRRLSDPPLAAERPDPLPAGLLLGDQFAPILRFGFRHPSNMPLLQSSAEERFTRRLRWYCKTVGSRRNEWARIITWKIVGHG
jgi:hypothetical protein